MLEEMGKWITVTLERTEGKRVGEKKKGVVGEMRIAKRRRNK